MAIVELRNCFICGGLLNLRKDCYLSTTRNGITRYYHRPCPLPSFQQLKDAEIATSFVIRLAQFAAKKVIQEYSAVIGTCASGTSSNSNASKK